MTAAWLLAGALPAAAFFGAAGTVAPQARLFEAGRYGEVIRDLSPERLQKLRGRALREGYLLLAQSHEKIGEAHKAMSVYQIAVKLFPDDINLLTAAAQLLERMGLDDRAEPLFQKVLKIHPNNAASHLGLAEIDRALGFLDKSASHYEKALDEMGRDAVVWRDYAETLYQMRDYATAEPAVRKSLQLTDDPDARLLLAHILRATQRLDQALGVLDDAIGQRPQAARLRGLWLLEAKRYADAQKAAEDALRTDAADALAHYVRARCHLKADRYDPAIADLETAAAAGREAPFVARVASQLLARLRGRTAAGRR